MGRIVGWGSALLCLIFGLAAIWIHPETDTVSKTGYTALVFGIIAGTCFLGWLCIED